MFLQTLTVTRGIGADTALMLFFSRMRSVQTSAQVSVGVLEETHTAYVHAVPSGGHFSCILHRYVCPLDCVTDDTELDYEAS